MVALVITRWTIGRADPSAYSRALAFVAGTVLALASAPAMSAPQTRAPAPETRVEVVATPFAEGLVNPWALQFLPDGRPIVTERPGTIRIITRDGKIGAPVAGVPAVAAQNQGGLLDLALAPDFARSRMLFITYAEPRGGASNATAVASARLIEAGAGARLEDVRVIFRQEPATQGGLHFGSRIAIARDGRLFVTLGERYQMRFAQDLERHWGKVVRIEPDGRVPADNPFVTRSDARPEIWSYGHRNPQSAAIHPQTGKLWVVEHGARGGDEINVPLAGRNYGWPIITYGIDYSGSRIGEGTARAGLEQPIYYWDPSIAPSGMVFYTGDAIPEWKGNLLVGALRGAHLSRLVLEGEAIVAEEKLFANLGERIRDVRQGPDGAVWLLTDSRGGGVMRVTKR